MELQKYKINKNVVAPITVIKELIFFNGPIVMTARFQDGTEVLMYLAEENEETGFICFACSALPEDKLKALLKKEICVLEAIKTEKIYLLVADNDKKVSNYYCLPFDLVNTKFLPEKGLFLPFVPVNTKFIPEKGHFI